MTASLSLTSMIDVLVVTVVFLLLSFSPSESAVGTNRRVPPARYTLDALEAPLVSLVGSQVLVDGIASGNTCAVEETKQLA